MSIAPETPDQARIRIIADGLRDGFIGAPFREGRDPEWARCYARGYSLGQDARVQADWEFRLPEEATE